MAGFEYTGRLVEITHLSNVLICSIERPQVNITTILNVWRLSRVDAEIVSFTILYPHSLTVELTENIFMWGAGNEQLSLTTRS